MQAIQFNSHGRGTNSPVEHYTGGHGMSFCLEDQKPQPSEPPSPRWGFSFLGTSGRDPGEQFCTNGYCQGVQARMSGMGECSCRKQISSRTLYSRSAARRSNNSRKGTANYWKSVDRNTTGRSAWACSSKNLRDARSSNCFAQSLKLSYVLRLHVMPAFKIVHSRGADRAKNYVALKQGAILRSEHDI
jgi:hypothetical protein